MQTFGSWLWSTSLYCLGRTQSFTVGARAASGMGTRLELRRWSIGQSIYCYGCSLGIGLHGVELKSAPAPIERIYTSWLQRSVRKLELQTCINSSQCLEGLDRRRSCGVPALGEHIYTSFLETSVLSGLCGLVSQWEVDNHLGYFKLRAGGLAYPLLSWRRKKMEEFHDFIKRVFDEQYGNEFWISRYAWTLNLKIII